MGGLTIYIYIYRHIIRVPKNKPRNQLGIPIPPPKLRLVDRWPFGSGPSRRSGMPRCSENSRGWGPAMAMGQKPHRTPSDHPNPTAKIGPKMGGEFTNQPKWDPIGFDPQPNGSVCFLLLSRASEKK